MSNNVIRLNQTVSLMCVGGQLLAHTNCAFSSLAKRHYKHTLSYCWPPRGLSEVRHTQPHVFTFQSQSINQFTNTHTHIHTHTHTHIHTHTHTHKHKHTTSTQCSLVYNAPIRRKVPSSGPQCAVGQLLRTPLLK